MKQIIISVGREFGSGGHIVAQKLAEHYDIPIFNKELLEEMARKEGYSEKALEKYDEKPVNFGFMPLPYAGGNIPIEQEIAMKQFEFIKNKADAGESFVIVGRCADEILAYNPNLVSVFITGDRESKIARVMDREGLDRKQAINKMKRMDKIRKTYHNFYCRNKWGDSRGYDICINTGKTDFDTAKNMVVECVDKLKERSEQRAGKRRKGNVLLELKVLRECYIVLCGSFRMNYIFRQIMMNEVIALWK